MAGGNDPYNGGKVTQRDLFQLILDQNKERTEMERRIMEEFKKIDGLPVRVRRNEEEIEKLRARSNIADFAIAIGAAIGTFVSALIGIQR